MEKIILIYFLVFFEILFLITFIVYIVSLIYSSLKGSFYVPTSHKVLDKIFSNVSLNKNDRFLDLGSGDGRIVLFVAKKYNIKSIGIEINPLLVFISKLKTKIFKMSKLCFFYRQNLLNDPFPEANIIYLFLMPKLIEKIDDKLREKIKNGSLIISYGFKIPSLKDYLKKIVKLKPFYVYYYKKTKNKLSIEG